jgi:hypothetical protein
MKPEVATRRIKTFGERFGEAHLYLAYHAAFPLALTPDLLYRMWANFQRDINGEALNIPWMAVADLLLSSLCDEVGHELYEMDTVVRNALLKQLKGNLRFGDKRIDELSDFLLAYVQQQLDSHDPDMRDFAQAQRWTVLAYTKPSEVAKELASALSALKLENKAEWIRMASLVETFAEPLAEFVPLMAYARGMANLARGNRAKAVDELSQIVRQENKLEVAGVHLSVPEPLIRETEGDFKGAEPLEEKRTDNASVSTAKDTRVKTILVLAANPTNTSRLRLDEEVREIDEGLRRANKREQFKLEQKWAVRSRDFYRAILDTQPQIVHFTGHGAGEDGIVLEDETGQIALQADALSSMFKLFARKGVEGVLLNGCYLEVQAQAISQHIQYVIGINREIGDSAAVSFAVAFYDAIAVGEEVEFAYELGCSQLIAFKEHQTPVLIKRQVNEQVNESYSQTQISENTPVKTILVLAANPTNTSKLRLDQEVREIDEALRRPNKRKQFKLEQKWAVRVRDISRAMLDIDPQIVHFIGHGAGEDGIVLEDETGQRAFVQADALSGMFNLFATHVECVVLNRCYSQVQAQAISQDIQYVIGINREIGDRAAVSFAVAFYDAIAAGEEVEFAYEFGCSQLIGLKEHQTPVLIKRQVNEQVNESYSQTQISENMPVKTILLLAANPRSTSPLRLDEEIREIDAALQHGKKREQFKLVQKWAVRVRDIYQAMLDIQPQIVHFIGHGPGEDGIVLEDEMGQIAFVQADALSSVFELFATEVECVVLNGCYSQVQAEAISQHIEYVIGINREIGDRAGVSFAVAFYHALGAGREVEFAYKFGCAEISLIGEHQTPVLMKIAS